MAVLIDRASGFDVEVVGRSAIFFTDETLDLAAPTVWEGFAAVTPKVVRVSGRYTDARPPQQPHHQQRVAAGGRRPRRGRAVPAWVLPTVATTLLVAVLLEVDRLIAAVW